MNLCLNLIKCVYISNPSFHDYKRFNTCILFHALLGRILFKFKIYMKFHTAISQNQRHGHTCMYIYAYNELFLYSHRGARSCTAGYRTGQWTWARSTDWRCFYKTLLFPIYCSYQDEILTGALELLDGLLPKIFFNLWKYFTNYKERNFVVTRI